MTQFFQTEHWPLEFAVAGYSMKGETVSGDLGIVRPCADGGVVIALVDGIGHGPAAEEAAKVAAATLERQLDAPVEWMLECCHKALKATRGAVISVAAIDSKSGMMTWLGVGNVEARLLSAEGLQLREQLVLTAGIVGYDCPALRPSSTRIFPGDVVILTTDGIDRQYDTAGCANKSPEDVANHILSNYNKATDDAMVVVARYSGIK